MTPGFRKFPGIPAGNFGFRDSGGLDCEILENASHTRAPEVCSRRGAIQIHCAERPIGECIRVELIINEYCIVLRLRCCSFRFRWKRTPFGLAQNFTYKGSSVRPLPTIFRVANKWTFYFLKIWQQFLSSYHNSRVCQKGLTDGHLASANC